MIFERATLHLLSTTIYILLMSNVVGTLSEPEFDLFQVCTELDNHYSMNDKDLAEFIIDLAQKHADLEVRTTSIYIF